MDKPKAKRIYACACKIDELIKNGGSNDDIMRLTGHIRNLLYKDLSQNDCYSLDDTYMDYFDKDGNLRTCSLIH